MNRQAALWSLTVYLSMMTVSFVGLAAGVDWLTWGGLGGQLITLAILYTQVWPR